MSFPLHFLFFVSLVLGSFVAINSSSWFIAWLGLEVNLLSILPLMSSEKTKSSSESCIKYFLVQSMASLLILFSSVFVFYSSLMGGPDLIFVGLCMKLGVAPFHFWFPIVMEGVNWLNCAILMTWQKLAPLFLMSFVNLFVLVIILTSLVGSFGGFNQISVSKILAFSSISHVGWMLAGMIVSVSISIMYFFVYFLMSLLIVFVFNSSKLFYINQLSCMSTVLKLMILFSLLSLGGMPPFLGFFPKWFVIEKLLWGAGIFASILIFSSLINLYFYFRLGYFYVFNKFVGGEGTLGVTNYVSSIVAFFFLSSGGVFCFPLLSSI
uniref:NADH-ubiquinone oxidoreductase chain 2 n=1 Tax=Scorpiops tibetanus TaxID=500600 RepID=A0A7L9CVV4_SCOTI|nr:NADH dehydrogenase subunit 2 [Scorpiops tibetanus]QOJ45408.1 NADH dehydrogenase subunit 2 [Scorpiops tibetanus]